MFDKLLEFIFTDSYIYILHQLLLKLFSSVTNSIVK